MELKLKIGQVAALLGITPKTIRHYHRLNILPEPKRADNGYRVYSIDSLYRLNLIKSLKQIGLSLNDIKTILDDDHPDTALAQKLAAMAQKVATEISELQARQAMIQALIMDEATLEETRVAEFPVTTAAMPLGLSKVLEKLPPHLMKLEIGLYKQLDMFKWGSTYDHFLNDIFIFLETHPEFIEYFSSCFEQAKHMHPDDPDLDTLATALANNLVGTPIVDLIVKSSFSEDSDVFQTFLIISEETLAETVTIGQQQLFRYLGLKTRA